MMLTLTDHMSVGQNAMATKVVQHSDTADDYSNDLKNLLATPKLLHLAIDASIQAIDPYLPEDYVSVGVSINFVHTAPTSLGMHVTVRASILAIEDHDVLIELKAWDEQGDIGHGTHKRVVMAKKDVLEKAAERTRLLMNRQAAEAINGR